MLRGGPAPPLASPADGWAGAPPLGPSLTRAPSGVRLLERRLSMRPSFRTSMRLSSPAGLGGGQVAPVAEDEHPHGDAGAEADTEDLVVVPSGLEQLEERRAQAERRRKAIGKLGSFRF